MKSFIKFIVRFIIYTILLLLIIAVIGVRLLDHYLQAERIKPELEKALTSFLQRPVNIDKIYWQWYPQPLLFGENVRVFEKDGRILLKSPQIRAYPNLKQLLNRQVFINGLRFVDPVIIIKIRKDGTTNIETVVTDIRNHLNATTSPELSLISFFLHSIRLSEAQVVVVDERLKRTPLSPRIIVNGSFEIPVNSAPVRMTLKTTLQMGQNMGSMMVDGSIGERSQFKFRSDDFPLETLADYDPALVAFHCPINLEAAIMVTPRKTKWAIKGASVEPVLFFPKKKPKLQFGFDLRSNSTSTVQGSLYLDKSEGKIVATLPRLSPPVIMFEGAFKKADLSELYSSLRPFLNIKTSSAPVKKIPFKLSGQISVDHLVYENNFIDNLSAKISGESEGQWQAEVRAPRVSYKGENFSFSTATLTYQDGALSVSDLIFSGLEGQGTINCSFMNDSEANLPVGAKPSDLGHFFDVTWDVTNVDSLRLLSLFTQKTLTSGSLTSKGRLLGDRTKFISEDLKGSAVVTLNEGVITSIPGAVKYLSSMNVKSLIKKIKGKKTVGLPFHTFKATFKVNQGQLSTPAPIALHSDMIDLAFLGVVDLTKNTVDAEMELQFLTVLDEVVKFIPGIKQVFSGKRKSLVPIWLRIKGPIEDPDVKMEKGRTIRKVL